MTVPSAPRVVPYSGSGTTGPFTFSFRVLSSTDLSLTKVDSGGVRTPLSSPADYSVTLTDSGYSGGSITLSTALATGNTLIISGNTPLDQSSAFRNNTGFDATSHEWAFDKAALIMQELSKSASRSLRLKPESSMSNILLDDPVDGCVPVYSSSFNAYKNTSVTGGVVGTFSGYVSPKTYNCVGDGSTNDTTNFQACIDAVRGTSKAILLGAGEKYLVNGLTGLNNIAIVSNSPIEANSPYTDNGAAIWQTSTSQPLFEIGSQLLMQGITVYYPNQTNANYSGGSPIVYYPTFQPKSATKTQFIRIKDCNIINAYDGINLGQASYPTADVHIVGNRICALRRSITLNNSPDVIYLSRNLFSAAVYNDEINGGTTSLRDWMAANGVGIYVTGSNTIDGLIITPDNLFLGMNKGIHVAGGGLNICRLAGNYDGVEYGLYVDGSATLSHTVWEGKTYAYKNGSASASAACGVSLNGTGAKQLQIASSARFEYSQGNHIELNGSGADRIQIGALHYGSLGAGSGASGDKSCVLINNANAKVNIAQGDFFNAGSYANAIGVTVTAANNVTISPACRFEGFKTPVILTSTTTHNIGSIVTSGTTGSFAVTNASSGTGSISTINLDKPVSGKDGITKVLARYTSGGLVTSGTTPLTIIFNTEITDSNSEYNNSTGVFTATKKGQYLVSVVMNGAGSVNADLFQIKATATSRSIATDLVVAKASFVESAPTVSAVIDMSVGDTLSVIVTRLAGTGTFTPCQTDANLYPTLSITYIG